ncbi:hypothetical protein [Sporolactobacillus terrae]|uniref:hypothetical protein n=1 Tax=Sporolactobacillus terrae TaxID=269673 RepID=UPI00048E2F6E|nr:hypothetical protein [Sporolactobacillus terrae]
MEKTIIQTRNDTYFLRFSINAHCEAEELLGMPITQVGDNAGISTMRTLLYVGLKYGGRAVTMDQAGNIMEEIIDEKGMEGFTTKISEAVQKSFNKQNNDSFKRNQGFKKKGSATTRK